jgi:hypothetical protein
MDVKVTLSFNAEIISKAKKFADKHNISLSRLTEMLYQKMTAENYKSLEDFPISDWVNEVAEGKAVYKTKPSRRKTLKKEFFKSRK